MTKRPRQGVHNGTYLLAIGALHQVVGLCAGVGWIAQPGVDARAPLIEIIQGGVLGAVEPDSARIALVWFLLFGFMLLMLGSLVRWLEMRVLPLPRSLAVHVLLLSVLGVVLMPASGFWLCLPVAFRLFRYAARSNIDVRPVSAVAIGGRQLT
jgi:hypothetical protein